MYQVYLNTLKTEKILQFWNKKFATYVMPAQEVKRNRDVTIVIDDHDR